MWLGVEHWLNRDVVKHDVAGTIIACCDDKSTKNRCFGSDYLAQLLSRLLQTAWVSGCTDWAAIWVGVVHICNEACNISPY